MISPFPAAWNDQRYRAITEHQTELICCYLPDSTVTYVNDAYCQFFGLTLDQLVGRRFIDLFLPNRHDEILLHIHWQVIHKTPRIEIQTVRKPDGNYACVEWIDQALTDNDGVVIELLAVGHDATARLRSEEVQHQLAIVRTELARERELSELRANFLRMVTHELRTPLSIINMAFEMISKYGTRLSESEQVERLGVAQAQVKRMTTLLEDMTIALRTQMTHVPLTPIALDLSVLVKSIVTELHLTLGKYHEFIIDFTPEMTNVVVDNLLMHRILINLLTNAIKYSPHNTMIGITAWRMHDDVCITVRDHGIGIPEDDLRHLFEPFYRGGNVGSVMGTGVGLSLVRDCVIAHNGVINVESQIGVGTAFTITLPQPTSTQDELPNGTQVLLDWAASQR